LAVSPNAFSVAAYNVSMNSPGICFALKGLGTQTVNIWAIPSTTDYIPPHTVSATQSFSTTVAVGDVFSIGRTGSTFYIYQNGVVKATVTGYSSSANLYAALGVLGNSAYGTYVQFNNVNWTVNRVIGTVYTADRWFLYSLTNTSPITLSKQSSGSTQSPYCFRVQRSSTSTDVGNVNFTQIVESINALAYQGKTVTLSFQARAGANYSATGNVLVSKVTTGTGTDEGSTSFAGGAWTGMNPLSQNNTLTTTWQKFKQTVTIPANAAEIAVSFSFTPVGTAGAADYLEVNQVQLELGSESTDFEFLPVDVVLQRSLRYFEVYNFPSNSIASTGVAIGAANALISRSWKVRKRANPTVTTFGVIQNSGNWTYYTGSGWSNSTTTGLAGNIDNFVFQVGDSSSRLITPGTHISGNAEL